jgi:hypothetical protein
MLNKVTGLAGALAVLLAIVTAFVPMAGFNAALAILFLGMVRGIDIPDDGMPRMGLAALALPVAAAAMASIPALGTQLGALLGGLGLAAAGVFAVGAVIRAVKTSIGAVKGLMG